MFTLTTLFCYVLSIDCLHYIKYICVVIAHIRDLFNQISGTILNAQAIIIDWFPWPLPTLPSIKSRPYSFCNSAFGLRFEREDADTAVLGYKAD